MSIQMSIFSNSTDLECIEQTDSQYFIDSTDKQVLKHYHESNFPEHLKRVYLQKNQHQPENKSFNDKNFIKKSSRNIKVPLPSKKSKQIKKQLINFYKNLLMTQFFIDFYYEFIQYLIQNNTLKLEIQKKIKANLFHQLTRFHAFEQKQERQLQKFKARIFYKEYKNQFNCYKYNEVDCSQIDFDKILRKAMVSNRQDQLQNSNKTPFKKIQNATAFNLHEIKKVKGIPHLKQKLLDKKFLENISQQQYFHLYYRYVTFRSNTYKAKLSDKLLVSEFFINYWKIETEKYERFQVFFEGISQDFDESYIYDSDQFMDYPFKVQQLQKICEQKTVNLEFDFIRKSQHQNSQLYMILICFRYIISNCIYIEPFNQDKRELFTCLICQYFLIDNEILTCQHSFNFLIPWYRVVAWHHGYFRNQQLRQLYFKRVTSDNEELKAYLQENRKCGYFFQFIQKIWRIRHASRIVYYRNNPTITRTVDCAYFQYQLEFAMSNKKFNADNFTSQTGMSIFLKFIKSESLIFNQFSNSKKIEIILNEKDLKDFKSQVLKNNNIQDKTKINLIKRAAIFLFAYEQFIHQLADFYYEVQKQRSPLTINYFCSQKRKIDHFKNKIELLKSSQHKNRIKNLQMNNKNLVIQLLNKPFSYYEVQDFHFRIVQKLASLGLLNDSKMLMNTIQKSINCFQISKHFFHRQNKEFHYYIDKNYKEVTQIFQKSVSYFNPYVQFLSDLWLNDLIMHSNVYINEQSFFIRKTMTQITDEKSFEQYIENDSQYLSYQKFVKINKIFVQKLKIYLKTLYRGIRRKQNKIRGSDFAKFFVTSDFCVKFLTTQTILPKNFNVRSTQVSIVEEWQKEKRFFFQFFKNSIPLDYKSISSIANHPILRKIINNFELTKSSFKQFPFLQLQLEAIKNFDIKNYDEVIRLVYNHSRQIGFSSQALKQNVLVIPQKIIYMRILLLYVKAYFNKYILKDYCWFQKYDFLKPINSRLQLTDEQLQKTIQDEETRLIFKGGSEYFIFYKKCIEILFIYFLSNGNYTIAFQSNAPTLQYLIQQSKKIQDQSAYFNSFMYFVSLSRFLSNKNDAKLASYALGNIQEFSIKSIVPIYRKFFNYMSKYTFRFINSNYEQFQNQIKQWKNPYFWSFANLFVKYSNVKIPSTKILIFKIASSFQYMANEIKENILPIFYLNFLKYLDYQCMQKKCSMQKYKKKMNKLLCLQTRFEQSLQRAIIVSFRSLKGQTPLIYQTSRQTISLRFDQQQKQHKYQDIPWSEFYCFKLKQFHKAYIEVKNAFRNKNICSFKYHEQNQHKSKGKKKKFQTSTQGTVNYVMESKLKRSSSFSLDHERKQQQKKYSFSKNKVQLTHEYDALHVSINPQFKRSLIEMLDIVYIDPTKIAISRRHILTEAKIIDNIIEKLYVKLKNLQVYRIEERYEQVLKKKKKKRTNQDKNSHHNEQNVFFEDEIFLKDQFLQYSIK